MKVIREITLQLVKNESDKKDCNFCDLIDNEVCNDGAPGWTFDCGSNGYWKIKKDVEK